MQVIKPPQSLPISDVGPTIFLAGSIEMGKAFNWQMEIEELFKDIDGAIFNPRRDDWNSTWEQDAKNPQFAEQVNWELQGLEEADIVVVYFDPETLSPVTLLELGLLLQSRDPASLFICCPQGFWRKGNVDITCKKYGVAVIDSLETLKGELEFYL